MNVMSLLSDGGDPQSRANENPMKMKKRIKNRIKVKSLKILPLS